MITGLENTGNEEAADLAFELTQKWIRNVWVSYEQSDYSIFEKYDVLQVLARVKCVLLRSGVLAVMSCFPPPTRLVCLEEGANTTCKRALAGQMESS